MRFMEAVNRYTIPFKGLKCGSHAFEFSVDRSLFEAYEASEILDGDCQVKVLLERSQTQLAIDVEIHGEVVVACDRCLEDCPLPIDYEGRLLVKFADQTPEYDGEVLWLSPAESEVDLTQYIYESVILSLPYQRVHAEGECNPEMMKRFRIVSSEEFASIEAQAEQEEEGAMPQEELAKLAALKKAMEGKK